MNNITSESKRRNVSYVIAMVAYNGEVYYSFV